MPTRTFAITADDKPVALNDQGVGEITINVSNTSAKPIRGGARLVPLGATRLQWLRIDGEVERNFSAHEVHQFVVRIKTPLDTPSAKYSFRLNVVSVQNPDEDYAEGPVVSFEVHEAKPVFVPEPEKSVPQTKKFYVTLAVILIAGAVTVALLLATMPPRLRLIDCDLNTVMRKVTTTGLELTNVTVVLFVQLPATCHVGQVFLQIPPAGTRVKKGSGVSVTIAELRSNTTTVPSVVGLTLETAIESLATNKIIVTNLDQSLTPFEDEWNIVCWQSKTGGSPVGVFTPVSLKVYTWEGPPSIPDTAWGALGLRRGGFVVKNSTP